MKKLNERWPFIMFIFLSVVLVVVLLVPTSLLSGASILKCQSDDCICTCDPYYCQCFAGGGNCFCVCVIPALDYECYGEGGGGGGWHPPNWY